MGQPPRAAAVPPGHTHLRLTLSALAQASADPTIWRRADVHRVVLISGLTALVGALAPIRRDLEGRAAAKS
jgi:hypothetical protein